MGPAWSALGIDFMQVVPRLSVEPMRYEDIATVQSIERDIFVSPWPKNAYASELAQNVVVRVMSRRGLPVSGALVTFRLAEGDGAAEPASALSDADGRARTSWTLGRLPGSQRTPYLHATGAGAHVCNLFRGGRVFFAILRPLFIGHTPTKYRG